MSGRGPNRRGGYDYGMTGSYDYGMDPMYDYGGFLPHYDQPDNRNSSKVFGRPYNPSDQQGPHAGRGPKRSDSRIREDVVDRLTDHPWLDASNIEVEVDQSEVTLSGLVDSRQDKRLAEDVAESVPGVIDVHNQLRIRQGQG